VAGHAGGELFDTDSSTFHVRRLIEPHGFRLVTAGAKDHPVSPVVGFGVNGMAVGASLIGMNRGLHRSWINRLRGGMGFVRGCAVTVQTDGVLPEGRCRAEDYSCKNDPGFHPVPLPDQEIFFTNSPEYIGIISSCN
jgi:hypothetical protein